MRIPRKLKKLCKRIAVRNYLIQGYGVTKSKHIRITDVVKGECFIAELKANKQ